MKEEKPIGVQAKTKYKTLKNIAKWCREHTSDTPAFGSLANIIDNCASSMGHIAKDLGEEVMAKPSPSEVKESEYKQALACVINQFDFMHDSADVKSSTGLVKASVWDNDDLIKRPVNKETADAINNARKLLIAE